jgi:hypothetical protein
LLNVFGKLSFHKSGVFSAALDDYFLRIRVVGSKAGDTAGNVIQTLVNFFAGAIGNVNANDSHSGNFLSSFDVLIISKSSWFVNTFLLRKGKDFSPFFLESSHHKNSSSKHKNENRVTHQILSKFLHKYQPFP